MKFKINTYYVLYFKDATDPTFGLYKCIDVKDDDVIFETFYAAGVLGQNFYFIKFESNDFWPYHLRNLYDMHEVEDYDIFKNVVETLFCEGY